MKSMDIRRVLRLTRTPTGSALCRGDSARLIPSDRRRRWLGVKQSSLESVLLMVCAAIVSAIAPLCHAALPNTFQQTESAERLTVRPGSQPLLDEIQTNIARIQSR